MNIRQVLVLASADIKNVRRDPMLIMSLLASLIFGLLLRFGLPPLITILGSTLSFDLTPWQPLIQVFFLFIGSMLCGFLSAFMILEEKDSRLFESLFTTPVGKRGYWIYRSCFPAVLSFCSSALIVFIGSSNSFGIKEALVFVYAAAQSVMFSALLSTISANKIEALALGKAIGIVMVGIFIPWFVPAPWFWLASWLPTFWPGLAVKPSISIWTLLIGLLVHAGYLSLLLAKSIKRQNQRLKESV